MLKLELQDISKRFDHRKVFENISMTLVTGQSVAIVGPNGSGKTTLLQIIIGLMYPDRGKVVYSEKEKVLDFDHYRKYLALVAPYFSLYGALTARENLRFFNVVDGHPITNDKIDQLLDRVGLAGRADDFVDSYSTGMRQRLKYAVALSRDPKIVMIDEPSANLDDDGKKMVFDLITAWRKESIVFIATNEKEEYRLADQLCQLGE